MSVPSRAGRLIVDGMNVIGSRPDRWWNDPDAAIHRLAEELDRYAGATGRSLLVVFDRRPPDMEPGVHGSIEVAFASRRGRNAADHDIVRLVAEDPTPESIAVVTSDRDLARRVEDLGAHVTSAGSFRRTLDAHRSG